MIVIYLILGVFNLLMAGKLWGAISIGKSDGIHVKWTMYAWAIANFVIGVFMIIAAIGNAVENVG